MFRLVANSSKRILTQQQSKIPSSLRGMSTAVSTTPESSTTTPSVMDHIVTLNFVDPSGARRQVPGYIGKRNVTPVEF